MKQRKQLQLTEEQQKLMLSWILGSDTGCSSQTIWTTIMGIDNPSPSIPYDSDDFGRCWRMLAIFNHDEINKIMKEVAKKHQVWKPYTKRWEEFDGLYVGGQMQELNKRLRNQVKIPEDGDV